MRKVVLILAAAGLTLLGVAAAMAPAAEIARTGEVVTRL
jgi:hypothetical protein